MVFLLFLGKDGVREDRDSASDGSRGDRLAAGLPKSLAEVVFRCALEANEIVGAIPEMEHLPPGEPLQRGKDRDGLFPVVADPGQGESCQAKPITAELLQETPG